MSTPRAASSKRLEQFLSAPKRAVWTLALPLMMGMAVHTLYIVVDTAFIGTLGTEALAAATFVAPLFFVMIALTVGLSTGVTALVAQAVGRRDAPGAGRVAGTSMATGLALGTTLTATGLAGGPALLQVLGASGPVAELGWSYFRIIALIVPLFFVSTVFRSVLTGTGDAKTPTLVLTGSTVINIGLDALFILGLGMGLPGAALATGAAQIFTLTAYSVLIVRRRDPFVRFRLQALRLDAAVLRGLGTLSAPAAAGMLVMSFGSMLINRLLAEFGEVTVAAFGAANKIDMIVAMPLFGLAGAMVGVVGMFAGARRADLVRFTALYVYRWALIIAVVIGASAYLGSAIVLRAFTSNTEAIAVGATYLGFMVCAYPMMAVGITTSRLLQGLGYGLPALVITTVRVLIVGVPVAYAAVYLFDAPVEAVWAGVLSGGVAATLLSIAWVRAVVWRSDPTLRAAAFSKPNTPPDQAKPPDSVAASATSTTPPSVAPAPSPRAATP